MNKIFYCGVLSAKGAKPYGGGEIGCQRTLDFLRKGGYNVTAIRRVGVKSGTKRWQAWLSYPFRTALTTIEFIFYLLFGSRKAIVHLACFYGVTIWGELILLHIAKALGYKVICELRAGGAKYFYDNGSCRYKKHFVELITKADYLFSQGKENLSLIAQFTDKNVFYYPNCIDDNFTVNYYPTKPTNSINVIFYGRITESKNILFIIEVVKILQQRLNNVTLTIIGSGVETYLNKVKKSAKDNLIDGSVTFLPSMMHTQIRNYLADKHIYIFPSEEKREGHSNAVTEVMSWGIVPIASPQGFNRTVIGFDELIIPKLNVKAYADAIISMFENQKFVYFSRQVYQRVKENYTESIVFDNLMEEYSKIFS
jgi:glycosyltransferase involved in cell wall biosynthesis